MESYAWETLSNKYPLHVFLLGKCPFDPPRVSMLGHLILWSKNRPFDTLTLQNQYTKPLMVALHGGIDYMALNSTGFTTWASKWQRRA